MYGSYPPVSFASVMGSQFLAGEREVERPRLKTWGKGVGFRV